MDDRPLVTVTAARIGEVWTLRPETKGKVANGLYLMLPVDSIAHAADICMDIGRGMAARSGDEKRG